MLFAVFALVAAHRVAGVDEVAGHAVLAAAGVRAPAGCGGVQPGSDGVLEEGILVGLAVPGAPAVM